MQLARMERPTANTTLVKRDPGSHAAHFPCFLPPTTALPKAVILMRSTLEVALSAVIDFPKHRVFWSAGREAESPRQPKSFALQMRKLRPAKVSESIRTKPGRKGSSPETYSVPQNPNSIRDKRKMSSRQRDSSPLVRRLAKVIS